MGLFQFFRPIFPFSYFCPCSILYQATWLPSTHDYLQWLASELDDNPLSCRWPSNPCTWPAPTASLVTDFARTCRPKSMTSKLCLLLRDRFNTKFLELSPSSPGVSLNHQPCRSSSQFCCDSCAVWEVVLLCNPLSGPIALRYPISRDTF